MWTAARPKRGRSPSMWSTTTTTPPAALRTRSRPPDGDPYPSPWGHGWPPTLAGRDPHFGSAHRGPLLLVRVLPPEDRGGGGPAPAHAARARSAEAVVCLDHIRRWRDDPGADPRARRRHPPVDRDDANGPPLLRRARRGRAAGDPRPVPRRVPRRPGRPAGGRGRRPGPGPPDRGRGGLAALPRSPRRRCSGAALLHPQPQPGDERDLRNPRPVGRPLTGGLAMSPRRPIRDEDLDEVIGAVVRATRAFVGIALRALDSSEAPVTLPQYRTLATLDVD